MEQLRMSPSELYDFIHRRCGDGRIFHVHFIKRTDGSRRDMTARLGVWKGVKGIGHNFSPKEKALICVYDMQKIREGVTEKGAFRMINLETVFHLKINGEEFDVEVLL